MGLPLSIVMSTVWPSMVLGTGLVVLATVAGWNLAAAPWLAPVRVIAWWLRHFIRPLLACRSWSIRTGAIFLNNASILTALVALGQWRWIAVGGAAGLGLSLGIGLRILSADPSTSPQLGPSADASRVRRIRLGVGLNLLEPPAIMVAIGLSLGRQAIPLGDAQVWGTFAMWVLPATLIAAGGESLWLGTLARPDNSQERIAPQESNGDSEA